MSKRSAYKNLYLNTFDRGLPPKKDCVRIHWKYQSDRLVYIYCTHSKTTEIQKNTYLGGNWNNASNADTFYWNLNNSVSNSNRNLGTRKMMKYDV